MNIECVSDKALEDVSGGFSYTSAVTINDVKLSQKEFDELKDAKIIGDDGKLYYRDVKKAVNFLREKGYEEKVNMIPLGIIGTEIIRIEHECWEKNEPVRLEII